MSRFGAGIRRGVMAADQFTQIANGLFRDARLSFKAKGIFGFISTHATGWHVTVANLVRDGPDGRDAVRAGLSELQRHGYLVRNQLRHDDGTLGEIVYSITDRPASLDTAIAQTQGTASVCALPNGSAADFGAGICRGVMAADQFTQIANGLFRDRRLSFKARGLFGLISTHRNGWRMSAPDVARRSRDGQAAVKSGLKELEKHGFLLRERKRHPDGTLGAATYVITDLPSLQSTRSEPMSGFPPVDSPTSVHRPAKNTNRKNTTKQKTSPLRPCDRADVATPPRASRPDTPAFLPVDLPADEIHPGIRLLLEIGAGRPELLLTGKALSDQGRVVTVMMESGWSSEQLHHVIADRPLPSPVRTSVGAIIAARLRSAQAYPPPAAPDSRYHRGDVLQDEPPAGPVTEQSSAALAARTVAEALTYRALVECACCGVPGTALGEDLCPACLGWPPCRTCPGPTPRRARPDSDGRCTTCATASTYLPQRSTP
ncbi:hypothetical protein [Streptomyces sp. NBC_00568]|uniref:hypothetical protein n=1 Tax=Streptomyces sp. NBC_00568 TaxID=2975779 RepID=UPI002250A0EA|nr:hypothetical protein [Streptomyces sp. NBC_00568]MCX4993360.1 helix-turn-helix domain-containing protein [Streptomyces sp. NBC_00568]